MSNEDYRGKAVAAFIDENPDVRDLIFDILQMRKQFDLELAKPSENYTLGAWQASLQSRKRRYADLIVPAAIGVASLLAGKEARAVFAQAATDKGGPTDARILGLEKLARHIQLLDLLLPETGEDGEIATRQAVLELMAISRGDDPRYFAKLDLGPNSRRRANAFRLAHHQAHALMWDAYFRAEGLPPKEVKLLVGSAFGEDHTTYERWGGPVLREAGHYLNLVLNRATNARHLLARDLDDAKAKLQISGEKYRAEKRRQAG